MNKILYSLRLLLLLTLSLVSCGQRQDELLTESFRVLSTEIPTAYTGGAGLIRLSEGDFEATSSADWCQIQVSGSELRVSVARHEGYDARTANIHIQKGARQIDIPVTQLGTINYIRNIENLNYEATGGEISFEMFAQAQPVITMSEGGDRWLSYKVSEGRISFSALPNEGPGRNADVFIVIGAYRMRLSAYQKRNPSASGAVEPVRYEDLLGRWVLEGTYVEDRFTQEVEIVQAVHDQLYILRGLGADIPLMFDEDKRGVRIPMVQALDGKPNVQLLFVPDPEHLSMPLPYEDKVYLQAPTTYTTGNRLFLTFTSQKTILSDSTGEQVPINGLVFWDTEADYFWEGEGVRSIITSITLSKKLEGE